MDWLRLWHDMPNDPKWRTIARQAKQPIALVQALYLHLLVDASMSETRGNADVTVEDLSSALDVDEDQIEAILSVMQGRVLEGRYITGWDKRQPKRNDDSKERVRRYREKKAAESDNNGGPDGGGSNENNDNDNAWNDGVTQCNASVTPRLEERRGESNNTPSSGDDAGGQNTVSVPKAPEPAYKEIIELYNDLLGDFLPQVVKPNEKRKRMIRARWKEVFGENSRGDDLNFWRRYFLHVRRSKPLTGTKDGFDWRPSFDWLLNETNMLKVIEGNYHQGDDRRSDLQEAS